MACGRPAASRRPGGARKAALSSGFLKGKNGQFTRKGAARQSIPKYPAGIKGKGPFAGRNVFCLDKSTIYAIMRIVLCSVKA